MIHGPTIPPSAGVAPTTPSPNVPDVFVVPGACHQQPIIFEPNPPLTASTNEVWILASGGSNWGGGNIFVSTDGSTYKYVGTIYTGGKQGVLTTALNSFNGTNPDKLPDFLAVDTSMSRGALNSASAMDAANFVSLCYCDGELLSYQTAQLTSTNRYNLTTLYRGLYGTTANVHQNGSNFAYLGIQNDIPGLLKYPYPPSLIGTLVYFKIQSFNQYGNIRQGLDTCVAYEYILTGRGSVNPTNIPFSYNGVPQNNIPILNYTFGGGVIFPANLSGSVCTSGVPANSSTTFSISKHADVFATMTFGVGATSATFAGAAVEFISGDVLKITPTRTDAALANLTGNLAGRS